MLTPIELTEEVNTMTDDSLIRWGYALIFVGALFVGSLAGSDNRMGAASPWFPWVLLTLGILIDLASGVFMFTGRSGYGPISVPFYYAALFVRSPEMNAVIIAPSVFVLHFVVYGLERERPKPEESADSSEEPD